MKKFLKELLPYLIIIVVVITIRIFIVTPVQVSGDSMKPTLKNNEILLLKKYDRSFKRFDIVVIDYDDDRLIKRIIGLPGETLKIENDKLYINGKYVKQNFKRNSKTYDYEYEGKIPKDYYFVMGDNRNNSTDSRIIGAIHKKDIKGVIGFSIIPIKSIK